MNDCPELNKNGSDAAITKEKLNIHYKIVTIDLTKARPEFQSHTLPEVYNELRIIQSPSAFNMKLNSKNADVIPVAANQTIPLIILFRITELFIKNIFTLVFAASPLDR